MNALSPPVAMYTPLFVCLKISVASCGNSSFVVMSGSASWIVTGLGTFSLISCKKLALVVEMLQPKNKLVANKMRLNE